MKKQEVLAVLEELPEQFDGEELLFVLSIKDEIERAEAAYAAEAGTPPGWCIGRREPSSAPSSSVEPPV
jgi:hypothetical protein